MADSQLYDHCRQPWCFETGDESSPDDARVRAYWDDRRWWRRLLRFPRKVLACYRLRFSRYDVAEPIPLREDPGTCPACGSENHLEPLASCIRD